MVGLTKCSGPPKSVGSGGPGGSARGRRGLYRYHTSCGQHNIGVANFLNPGLKFIEKSIENGLEESKFSNVWLSVYSGVVATTLIYR